MDIQHAKKKEDEQRGRRRGDTEASVGGVDGRGDGFVTISVGLLNHGSCAYPFSGVGLQCGRYTNFQFRENFSCE